MAFDFSSLITDRGPGTFYNVSDLNRVEAACADLYQRFTDYGYLIPDYVPVVNHWTESKTPTVGQLGRDLTNITALRNTITALSTTPETPETMRFWDYLKANDIERILQDLDTLITNMEQAWFFSGDLYAGET